MMVTLLFLLPPPTLQHQSDIEVDVEVEAGLNSIVHNISSTLNVSFL
jgi:hypothetical protein